MTQSPPPVQVQPEFRGLQAMPATGDGWQMLLRKGDDAAAQLLAPTTIVLIGVILIIMVAAMSGMDMAI